MAETMIQKLNLQTTNFESNVSQETFHKVTAMNIYMSSTHRTLLTSSSWLDERLARHTVAFARF